MNNPRFTDEENIPLVRDKDYGDCNTPDTSIIKQTWFTDLNTRETTST